MRESRAPGINSTLPVTVNSLSGHRDISRTSVLRSLRSPPSPCPFLGCDTAGTALSLPRGEYSDAAPQEPTRITISPHQRPQRPIQGSTPTSAPRMRFRTPTVFLVFPEARPWRSTPKLADNCADECEVFGICGSGCFTPVSAFLFPRLVEVPKPDEDSHRGRARI